MKVCEVIDNYNIERPNDVSDDRKLRYITNLERLVFTEIILTHKLDEKTKDYILDVVEAYEKEQALLEDEANDDEVIKLFFKDKKDDIDIDTYFKAFNYDTELMADGIYSQLYMHYIDQQIASAENEPKRYNASTTMYNNAYITFQDYWNRTHMPLSRPLQVAHHQDRVGKDVFPPVAKDDSPAVKKLKEIIKKVLLELHLSEAIIKIFVNGYEKPVDNGTVEIDVPTKVSELDNDKEYVTKDSLVGLAKVTDIPTDVSAFNNDAGYLTAHQDISGKQNKLTAGKNVTIINDVISADASGDVDYDEINNKPSINGVELVGNKTSDDLKLETGKVDGVKVNGVLQTIANRIVNIIVPTKTSELTNDSGFLTTHQNISNLASKDELSATATAIVDSIPTKISDLTDDSSFITQADIDSKVDKVAGKGLSTNDYTNADRSEVAKIANKQDKLVSGDNIEINGNKISANLTNIAYANLKSKPSINGVELVGNKTTADLKIDGGKVDGIKVNGVLATIKNRIAELTFPTKLSEFINDAGYLDAHQDLSDYAKLSDIPHNVSYFDNDAHYLTVHQDISHLQRKLKAGPGIVINNDLISATGEGGSGGTYTNPSVASGVGGVQTGTVFEDTPIQEVFDMLFSPPYTKPTISIGLSCKNLYDKNDKASIPTTITITANVSKKTEDVAEVCFYAGATLINKVTSGVASGGVIKYTYTVPADFATTTFRVTCKDIKGGDASSSTKVTLVALSYFGVLADEDAITPDSIAALTSDLKAKVAGKYNYTTRYGRFIHAVPKEVGVITSAKDVIHSFDYTGSCTFATMTINGEAYSVCYLKDSMGLSNIEITYA